MSLPGAPFLERRGGRLVLDGVDLDRLAAEHGTPLYAYSRGAIRAAARAWRAALRGRSHLVCYAVKANSNLAVLRAMVDEGLGFDIVSAGELARVLAAGGRAGDVVFSGVGKTADEMRIALQAGVRCFNVEGEAELDTLDAVAGELGVRAPVSLRVNPDVDAGTHPYISTGLRRNKFGIPHARARTAYARAASLAHLRIVGIDCHIGSQITQAAPIVESLDRLLDLVEALEADGIEIDHVDVGGGLGIDYGDGETPPPSPRAWIDALLARLDARGHGQRFMLFEPGRSLVGNAGVLLARVLSIKPGDDTGNDTGGDTVGGPPRDHCIVDAAMNDLLRPTLYDAWMAVEPCVERGGAAPRRVDVVGPVCESGDWLARDRRLAVAPGDTVAVLSAGAYGMAMASNYNTRPRPAEVMLDAGRASVVRRRETLDDLLRGESVG